jgi:hypothetical protein
MSTIPGIEKPNPVRIPLTELSETPGTNTATKEIPVTIVKYGSDPDRPYRLFIPQDKLYLEIDWEWSGTIVWRLDVTHLPIGVDSAYFDAPGVTVHAGWDLMTEQPDQTTITMQWWNTEQSGTARPNGRSFAYQLHVVVMTTVNGTSMKIPISHDPTVHNQPPIP